MQSLFQDEVSENFETIRKSVLVPYPVDKAYDYALPDDMQARVGDYICVPLGSREVAGVVWGDSADDKIDPKKVKAALSRYDLPSLPKVHRDFLSWVSQYTMAPLGSVLKLTLSVSTAFTPPTPSIGYTLNKDYFSSLSPQSSPRRGEEDRSQGDREGGRTYQHKPSQTLISNARSLRTEMTDAEKKLWYQLRKGNLGFKFRRQHIISSYIVDFACIEQKLIIELDGGQHDANKTQDAKRDKALYDQGFRVLRFWNNEVIGNFEAVLSEISKALQIPPTSILPPAGGGRREASGGGVKLTEKQKSVVGVLSGVRYPMRASEVADQAGCSSAVVTGMASKELLKKEEVYSAAPCQNPDPKRSGPKLSDAQNKAAENLKELVKSDSYSVSLLDGVTGAGKTEVYFEAVAQALGQGKQVLILLPEIALSNAFLDRFKDRFGCAPALWHSSLSPARRKNTWRGVAFGETKVVIGARSALFLPYQDLGLIIVDEEHDPAYKQEDGVIYNARDMAIVRAHLGQFPICLVSATPSMETMHNAWAGRYHHFELPSRYGEAQLPDVHIIDMKADKLDAQHFISTELKQAITQTLERKEQALLFLNRRGYAPLTLCRTCGHRFQCPRCSAWMVEHKRTKRLHCHHCDHYMNTPKTCPSCDDEDSLAACGPGVERIYEEAKTLFPDANIAILSSDTADTHDKLKEILAKIHGGKIDIIVGTQIIAKGHHFPKLTCVGVVDADLGLSGGDLRASERTYQLLHQVSGRAGRAADKGHVYLQSFFPESRVMQALASNDRDAFLQVEEDEREDAFMPPFSRLVGIIVSGRDEEMVANFSRALGQSAPRGEGLQTLGPAEAPIYRLRGKYRRRLLIRADKKIDIQKAIKHWLSNIKTPSTIRVQIDIDPQSFL